MVRPLINADPGVIVWWGTRTECVSAVMRPQRDGTRGSTPADDARAALERLASTWSEVQPSEPLRVRAERLLAVHPLRAADAFQLAAALLWLRFLRSTPPRGCAARVKDLRQRTSMVLDIVRRGQEVIVTYRGKRIAVLAPLERIAHKDFTPIAFSMWRRPGGRASDRA